MKTTFVTIKLNSIQEYIFHSNRLKENIGASQITSHELFRVCMRQSLNLKFPEPGTLILDYYGPPTDDKEIVVEEIQIFNNAQVKCEVADIGGGGAMVLFKSEKDAVEFIETFSKTALLRFPGLKISFAYTTNDLTDYKAIKKELNEKLDRNKNEWPVISTIQKHGITADCPRSNESAERKYKDNVTESFISNLSYSKIQQSDISAERDRELLEDNIKYELTTEIENLGQNEEAGYIAVVHIDGNGMGAMFKNVDSFEKLREASYQTQKAATCSMKLLIDDLTRKFEDKIIKEIVLKKSKDGRKLILPIRPILAGGDDITFVCEGRLGIYLAENFVRNFVSTKVITGACAGVAVVKTHFPFYKAYELAAELCSEAKALCRNTDGSEASNGKSYLSYYYSASTFSGSLEQLRERTHILPGGYSMYYGPYNICDDDTRDSIKKLKEGIKHFQNESAFAKNKTMRLREVIAEGHSACELFLKELRETGMKLPHDGKYIWYKKSVSDGAGTATSETAESKTPYFDQIELLDFYPNELLCHED